MNESGQGIVSALISLAILMAAVLALLSMQSSQQNAGKFSRLNTSRDRLIYTLPRIASMKGSLRNSIKAAALVTTPANGTLSSCITGGPIVCSSTTYYDFQLYAPSVDVADSQSGAITGTSAVPLYYSFNGDSCRFNVCSAADFPFQVYTRFRPICPVPPDGTYSTILNRGIIAIAACNSADEIEVELTIEGRPGSGFPIPTFKTSVFIENWLITGA